MLEESGREVLSCLPEDRGTVLDGGPGIPEFLESSRVLG